MKTRNLMITILVVQLVLLVVMLFQINTLNDKVDFVFELAGGDVEVEEVAVPTQVAPTVVEVSEDDDPWIGGENAKVTIVEFSDFECPFCARGAATIAQVLEEYGDDVKVVFRDFPLSFHQNAHIAAEAAECADEQDKFWEYHDVLFANQHALDMDSLKTYAADLGLDSGKFNECLQSREMSAEVDVDFSAGMSYGVQGTPAFFVNGELVSGAQPIEIFRTVIDSYL